ncbi:hypothetical protein [Erythrobacter sp. HL-111]|uniref:hypothetical protein n=1 Tax=Erythrobacter sp. HL-111 TaxID=1798193 RepID=UPI0006DBD105|nr:hypothetical protein [Erythrobacter sp. HL-111]KPP86975.1 MAG: hypothetical protein HLUCCO15_12490 [Erythrobacteraceae bacterium HL-111]SDS78376.1 hypothetical protein SAMN04515621_2224 [Erythrobacter sp. HL-111]
MAAPVTVELATHLDCSPEQAFAQVRRSALLEHIAAPLIRFKPLGRPFPEFWHPGEYRARMFLFGVIPIGWQAVVISLPEPSGKVLYVRDNGYGPLIRQWDHWIAIGPDPGGRGTRYIDQVTIDAGVLTPIVAGFARSFYTHRQRRWRALVESGFAALEG